MARELYRQVDGEMHRDVAYAASELAEALRLLHHPAQAETVLDEATTIEASGVDVPACVRAKVLVERACLRLDAGKRDEAGALAQRALKLLGPDGDDQSLAEAQLTLARALSQRDRPRASVAAQQALAAFEKLRDPYGREAALSLLALSSR